MAALLEEPEADAERLALDQALVAAVRARIGAGARGRVDADALALRGLLADFGATRDEAAVLKALWGRVETAGGLAVVAHGPRAVALAADRFGLGVRAAADPETALKAATEGARAVVDVAGRPWWARLLARPELKVAAALPDDRRAAPGVLVVSREPSGPTGDDHSFWVTDSALADARIVAALGQAGLAAEPMAASGGLKLFMLAGYVQADDGRLADAPGALSGVIGAAPVF